MTPTAATARSRRELAEECANALTHGLGLMLGVAALVLLIVRAVDVGRDGSLGAALVYGIALVLLYMFSTLQHAFPPGRVQRVFLSLDHVGIKLLIAGTYTPFCLLLPPGYDWAMFFTVWGLVAAGVTAQVAALATGRGALYEKYAFVFYLALGWVPVLIGGKAILAQLATPGLVFLVAGGLAYSIGVVFYLWRRLPFGHAVWHLFVVGGSTFHFFSVLFYVVPAPA
ncbi:MAG: hemolysin III family protein [Hyphomicrobiales bacterium]|nr:hemolysin III family protein [Hyphomicrobiales bacterium]MCP5373328.1 hemolysin III family protein [Hyphomicrobiales bacterium]